MTTADYTTDGRGPCAARILIVEDDPLLCWSLSNVLGHRGFSTRVVSTGEAAIDQLSSERFDLVITDRELSQIDGFEIAAFVKKSPAALPVIMISANDDPAIEDHLKKKVIDHFMEKPFDLDSMVSLIDECLRLQRPCSD